MNRALPISDAREGLLVVDATNATWQSKYESLQELCNTEDL